MRQLIGRVGAMLGAAVLLTALPAVPAAADTKPSGPPPGAVMVRDSGGWNIKSFVNDQRFNCGSCLTAISGTTAAAPTSR